MEEDGRLLVAMLLRTDQFAFLTALTKDRGKGGHNHVLCACLQQAADERIFHGRYIPFAPKGGAEEIARSRIALGARRCDAVALYWTRGWQYGPGVDDMSWAVDAGWQ